VQPDDLAADDGGVPPSRPVCQHAIQIVPQRDGHLLRHRLPPGWQQCFCALPGPIVRHIRRNGTDHTTVPGINLDTASRPWPRRLTRQDAGSLGKR